MFILDFSWILVVYAIINIISFSLTIADKKRSISNDKRIRESYLLFWAIAFGAAGVMLAMFLVRHKTLKWPFFFGVPIALIQNLLVLWLIYINFF
ncbi:MAG: DUF1294 domain-containing protein [Candidatus Komeilibacteria bacterium]